MNDYSPNTAQPTTEVSEPDALWLEIIENIDTLAWVEAQNQRTMAMFCQSAGFQSIEELILRELSQDSRIPWVSRYGEHFYNFWQDEKNPVGVWRRTTLAEYQKVSPVWESVLDLDELRREEGTDWVFGGATPLIPDYRYCLLHLSPGGGDACAIREFDLQEKRFIENGFVLPASKSGVSWIDHDSLYVADALGVDATNASGYPRVVKRWQRGTALNNAETVFEGLFEDVGAFAYRDQTPGFQRDFMVRSIDAYRREVFMLSNDGLLIKLDIPEDAQFSVFREWLLIKPASDWAIGADTYLPGQLLAVNLDDFLSGNFDVTTLFTPTAQTALHYFHAVGRHLVLNILDNVVSRLEVLSRVDGNWARSTLESPGAFNTLSLSALDHASSDYFLTVTGFLKAPSLYLGNLDGDNAAELLKQTPTDRDLERYRVSQHFATSADGTQVPYFEVCAADLPLDGRNPTLLYGYGGFQVSLRPGYLGAQIPAWLERGGVYVVANIRGGGEFGPEWHQAALRQNRHRAFEDFAAVAQSLIDHKMARPSTLGIRGASNGGLLMGNMLTRYPELFGCIVCEVPLLDMRRYTHLLAGSSWIAEYGDPERAEEWDYIRTFSPYHNLRSDVAYPPTLFLTTTSDDRVSPAHARKMAHRMQEAGHSQVYFHESNEGGHGGAADQKHSALREALISEFLWKNLASTGQD